MQTYVLTDGGRSTVAYLWQNGIKASHFLFSVKDLEETLPYCDPEEDNIIIIVNGCTHLKYTAVKAAIELITHSEMTERTALFSNIPIHMPTLNFEYILFDGDLMAGTEYIANTQRKFDINTAKPSKKERWIDKYKTNEATEDTVDIGEISEDFFINPPDAVPPSDIIQLNIFK